MIVKSLGLISLMMLLVMASCKKDDPAPVKTTKDYLTAHNWKMTAQVIDPGVNINGTIITDIFVFVPDCTKDDLTKFESNGSITDDEGATKCDPTDPQTTTDGKWVLSSDKKTMTITYPNEDPTSIEILTINDTTFKGKFTTVEDFGSGLITYVITVTFKKA